MSQSQLHPEEIRPELEDAQHDFKCQIRLNKALQHELCAEVTRFVLIKHRLEEENSYLRRCYSAIGRTLTPITTIKPSPSPRSNHRKILTKEETLKALARLCSPEVAKMAEQLLKEGKDKS